MRVNTAPPATGQINRMVWLEPTGEQTARPLAILPCLLNVRGRPVATLERGFGQHWEKYYRVRLEGIDITPEQVIEQWKENFPLLWPQGSIFYPPLEGIQEGSVALMKLAAPGGRRPILDTAVVARPVSDTGFTFNAFHGHPVAGSMAFSAYLDNGTTIAQAHASLRAGDPLYELMIRFFGEKEDEFWRQTLKNLAAHFGVKGVITQEIHLVDRRVRWSRLFNLRHNAGIRSMIYRLTYPFRFSSFLFRRAKRRKS